jgi:heme A synthase
VALAVLTRRSGVLARLTGLIAGLVVLQGVLGAVNVISFLHTHVTVAHSAVAALLFSATAVLEREMGRRKQAERQARSISPHS